MGIGKPALSGLVRWQIGWAPAACGAMLHEPEDFAGGASALLPQIDALATGGCSIALRNRRLFQASRVLGGGSADRTAPGDAVPVG